MEIRVYSTDTGKEAYFEISVEDEDEIINLLQEAGVAQALNRLLELV